MAGGRFRFILASMLLIVVAPAAVAADLTLVFTGAGPEGAVRAMVFDDPVAFAERQRPRAAVVLPVEGGGARATLSGLPAGRYAVAVFQDVNGDQTLDTSWLGVPVEPYGFSGGEWSSPGFDQAAFPLTSEGGTVAVRLR